MTLGINRRKLLSVLPGVLISLIAGPSIASIGPAIKPSKIGQIIVWRGKKYTAIKSGKAIIWDKGVALPVTPSNKPITSDPTPTPNALPTNANTPTPTAAPKKSEVVAPVSTKAEFIIAKTSQIKIGESKVFVAQDLRSKAYSFMITRTDKSFIAFSAVCPHQQSLVEIIGSDAVCTKHYSYFHRVDGHCLGGPALGQTLDKYSCEERNGDIWIIQD